MSCCGHQIEGACNSSRVNFLFSVCSVFIAVRRAHSYQLFTCWWFQFPRSRNAISSVKRSAKWSAVPPSAALNGLPSGLLIPPSESLSAALNGLPSGLLSAISSVKRSAKWSADPAISNVKRSTKWSADSAISSIKRPSKWPADPAIRSTLNLVSVRVDTTSHPRSAKDKGSDR
ncbi:hypothetical protein J6590_020826 [Homalodisca vitripennis]|nr:hypothetical protein J6590_020826 [Homalodisca vitripennis]